MLLRNFVSFALALYAHCFCPPSPAVTPSSPTTVPSSPLPPTSSPPSPSPSPPAPLVAMLRAALLACAPSFRRAPFARILDQERALVRGSLGLPSTAASIVAGGTGGAACHAPPRGIGVPDEHLSASLSLVRSYGVSRLSASAFDGSDGADAEEGDMGESHAATVDSKEESDLPAAPPCVPPARVATWDVPCLLDMATLLRHPFVRAPAGSEGELTTTWADLRERLCLTSNDGPFA